MLGQLCGAVLGAFIYVFTIEIHHPESSLDDKVEGVDNGGLETTDDVIKDMDEVKIETEMKDDALNVRGGE